MNELETLFQSPEIKQYWDRRNSENIHERFYSIAQLKRFLQREFEQPVNAERSGELLKYIAALYSELQRLFESILKDRVYRGILEKMLIEFRQFLFNGNTQISAQTYTKLNPAQFNFEQLKNSFKGYIRRLPTTAEKLCTIELFYFQVSEEFNRYVNPPEPETFLDEYENETDFFISEVWKVPYIPFELQESELLRSLEIRFKVHEIPLEEIRKEIEPATGLEPATDPGEKLLWSGDAVSAYRIIDILIKMGYFGEIHNSKNPKKRIVEKLFTLIKHKESSLSYENFKSSLKSPELKSNDPEHIRVMNFILKEYEVNESFKFDIETGQFKRKTQTEINKDRFR